MSNSTFGKPTSKNKTPLEQATQAMQNPTDYVALADAAAQLTQLIRSPKTTLNDDNGDLVAPLQIIALRLVEGGRAYTHKAIDAAIAAGYEDNRASILGKQTGYMVLGNLDVLSPHGQAYAANWVRYYSSRMSDPELEQLSVKAWEQAVMKMTPQQRVEQADMVVNPIGLVSFSDIHKLAATRVFVENVDHLSNPEAQVRAVDRVVLCGKFADGLFEQLKATQSYILWETERNKPEPVRPSPEAARAFAKKFSYTPVNQ